MILKRFHDERLAQTAWLAGCAVSGEAIVIDASRDLAPILEAAEREGLRITDVTETHIHADYVSGSRDLARRTGARLHLSGEGGPDWLYAFAEEEKARILRDGDRIRIGNILLDVLHTPGHTPEHLSFLLTDGAAANEPMGLFTGDFLFVGDVGRPDLLERAAGVEGSALAGARVLFRSLQRLAPLPDWLQIWPGHGAGSACGKGIGAIPQSTLGYERRFNPGLAFTEEEAFTAWVLAGQPAAPAYFREMKRVNREGPAPIDLERDPAPIDPAEISALLAGETILLDLRGREAFAAGHLPGSIDLPLSRSFPTWAGTTLPIGAGVALVGGAGEAREAARSLRMIGFDRIEGRIAPEALPRWADAEGRTLAVMERIGAPLLAKATGGSEDPLVIDVRSDAEWDAGHIHGAVHIPLGRLRDEAGSLPRGRDVVVSCQSGARSALAASLLASLGVEGVRDMTDGFAGWKAGGFPVERGRKES